MLSKLDDFSPVLGAEASIGLVDWYGKIAIRKARVRKTYRLETLDKQLRERRTKQEVEILHASKLAGVDCPEIYFADPESSEIIMEFVEGILFKNSKSEKNFQKRKINLQNLGKSAAKLHKKEIIHGDLTTKNVILSGERIVIIDFGLAFISDRIEDKAEDMHLLKQALKSSDTLKRAVTEFDSVMEGYEKEAGEKLTAKIKGQITKIERRGRYAQVD
jgi:TP53 regulating kinase and related kinases